MRTGRLSLALLGAALAGCNSLPFVPRPPAAKITTAAGTLEQTGAAQAPANLTTSSETRSVPLPAGTVIETAPPPTAAADAPAPAPALRITLARDSVLTTTTRTDRAEAPRAFTPPAPPTAAQLAQASGVRVFWIAALVGLAAAGLLLYRRHVLAAVCVGAGSAALPILARFYSSDVALPLSASLAALGVGLFVAWHLLRRRYQTAIPDE